MIWHNFAQTCLKPTLSTFVVNNQCKLPSYHSHHRLLTGGVKWTSTSKMNATATTIITLGIKIPTGWCIVFFIGWCIIVANSDCSVAPLCCTMLSTSTLLHDGQHQNQLCCTMINFKINSVAPLHDGQLQNDSRSLRLGHHQPSKLKNAYIFIPITGAPHVTIYIYIYAP